jgi:hypothetical protein
LGTPLKKNCCLQVDECLKCVNFLNEKLESGVDPNSAEIKVTISAAP